MNIFKRTTTILSCIFLTGFLLVNVGYTQNNDDFFVTVEEMPELNGSIDSLNNELGYTREAYDEEIEGKIIVRFIVNEEGAVEQPEVIRGLGHGLDQQALKVVKQAKFKPGQQRGQTVPVQYSIPVTFELSSVQTPSPPPQEEEEEDNFFVAVEEMPSLKGGLDTIQKKLKYPAMARESGIEGKVIIQFIVNKQGKAENLKVVRGIGSGCDEEAKHLIKEEAEFTPGKQRGELVRVQYSLPITFKLQN